MGDLRAGFVPTLDGEALAWNDDGTLVYADGRPVPASRQADVLYIPDEGVQVGAVTLTREDVADILLTLADSHRPPPPTAVDAGFFHRSLTQWLSHHDSTDDDSTDDAATTAPLWDYDFWKAELAHEGTCERPGDGDTPARSDVSIETFRAEVFRGETASPEHYQYWVAFDAGGAIVESGWLSPPPDLLGDPSRAGFQATELDAELVQALLADE